MLRLTHILRYSIPCLLLACGSQYAWAQNVVFTATGNTSRIGAKDQLQVTYAVRDAQDLKSITPGQFSDFVVVGGPYQSQSTNVSYAGNKMVQSSSISVTYILHPRHTGKLMISPGVAKDGAGHTFLSNAVSVEVVGGTLASAQPRRQGGNPFDDDPFGGGDPFAAMRQQMQQIQRMQQMQQQRQQQQMQQSQAAAAPMDEKEINKYIFIKVEVDKSKVYVGEQVTTSYKLYSRIPMQIGISKLPSLNGFWTQDFDIPRQIKPTEEIVDGKKYQVFLLKKSALFPQQTGTLQLDPAEAQGMARILQEVRQRLADDPALANRFGGSLMMNDPYFNNAMFSSLQYKDVQVHLKSVPVNITVTALPEKGKPANYGGAVGDFTIEGKINKQELTTDDAATYTLRINGSGNLKLIEAPKLQLPNGLDSYDPQVRDTITGRTNTISGTKIITYAITPHTPGDYEIPAIPFSYYNPQTGTYTTLQTQAVKIHVVAGKHYNPVAANSSMLKDIHDIDGKPLNNLTFSSKPILFTAMYWSMYALPLFLFVGIVAWKKRDEELSKDVVKLRNKRANKIALKRLTTAQKLLQEKNEKLFYEEISKAIWLYLSDKLNIPLSSLSRESARFALTTRKVPESLQNKMEEVMSECETALYAQSGSTAQMNHSYDEAVQVISELEDTI